MAHLVQAFSRLLHRHLLPSSWDRTRRSSPGRRKTALASQWTILLLTAGCVSAPSTSDWLAAGDAPFRSPEGTFRAFKTATAGDAADLGYRCLSSGFRKRNGIGQLTYRELFDRYSWLRYLSRAEVLERTEIGPNQIEFLCDIEVLFKTTRIRIGFIREDFYDLYRGAELVGGELKPFNRVTEPADSPRGKAGLAAWVPLPTGTSSDQISELRVGREWKIDSLELIDADSTNLP